MTLFEVIVWLEILDEFYNKGKQVVEFQYVFFEVELRLLVNLFIDSLGNFR